MPDPAYARLTDKKLRGRLLELRSAVEPILGGNYLPSFTDHSVEHSDRLCDLVDRLTEPLAPGHLQDREAFILYAACYLHDVGMQHQRAGETHIVHEVLQGGEYKGRKWDDLDIDTRRRIVREKHHRISGEMIRQSVDAAQPTILGVQPTQDWNPGPIASLCIAHCLDAQCDEYRQLTQDSAGIHMFLLSALLRLADIFDESRRRSRLYLERTRELDLESRTHWWRCYYVADIVFDPGTRHITLWFDFPQQRRPQYREMIRPLQLPSLEAEMATHGAVLAQHHLLWHFRVDEVPEAQSTAIPMDGDLEMYILQKLARDRERQAERDRLVILDQLEVARPTIERSLSELRARKDSCSADEYLEGSSALARRLWDLGGRREAWIMLWSEFRKVKSSASPRLRLDVAVELGEMMLQAGCSEEAARLLRDLRADGDSLADQEPLKWRFLSLLGRAYAEACAYEEAASTLSAAASLAPDRQSRALIEAEMAEIHLLQGELTRVVPNTDGTNNT